MIHIQSPTRVDLAGGTLDLWPLYLFFETATVVNLAIDICSQVTLSESQDASIQLRRKDLNRSVDYTDLANMLRDDSPEWALHRTVVRFFRPNRGFQLTTGSESPVGGGLGGSSSLVISLLRAFGRFCEQQYSERELVQVAADIEAQLLRTPTGTQDHWPAVMGGGLILRYSAGGVKVECLRQGLQDISHNLTLVDTGQSHQSGLNNWDIYKRVIDGDKKTLAALSEIRAVGHVAAKALQQGDIDAFGEIFQREMRARCQLSETVMSKEIKQLEKLVPEVGAQAIKICGAGGGGTVLLWGERAKVAPRVRQCGFRVLDFNLHVEKP